MTPNPHTNTLLRLTCAASAVLTSVLIGVCIHSLARTYDMAGEAQAAARHMVVAQGQSR